MARPIFFLSLIAGLLWSLFNWFLWALAGAGGGAVIGMANFLGIDPLSLTWLSETLNAVGSVAQFLVALIWLIGVAILVFISWLGGKAASNAEAAIHEARIRSGDPSVGRSPAVEGVVESRTVERDPLA